MDDLPPRLSPDEVTELRRRQRGKNIVVLFVLIGMAALFYAISIVRFKVS